MDLCGHQVVRFFHDRFSCGANVFIPTSCHLRPCKHCGKARGAREIARYADQIREFRMPALLTFTVPNVPYDKPEELPAAMELLHKGWEKLRRHKEWPKGARGVWSTEITYSDAKGYHPHIHAIVDLPWIDLRWLAKAWEELTGAKHCPDVTRPKNQEERHKLPYEGMKYVTKTWELPREALRTILAVTAGRRLFNSFGGLRAKKEDKEASGACCPGCQVPLSQCFRNMDRDTMKESAAGELVTWLKTEGRPVYTDWYYPDREPDRDTPPTFLRSSP